MAFDEKLIASKLNRWEKFLNEYSLPMWDDIPNIGLYMEQAISLIRDYIDYLPPELKDEEFITAATVNNYVRRKLMPEPVKKKYYRIHIAYLIMICTLKQSLSISTLHEITPVGISEEEMKERYNTYVKRHTVAVDYFISQVKVISSKILNCGDSVDSVSVESTEELISMSAVLSGLSRLLAEKLILLNGKTEQDFENKQNS